ncbi:MAG: hypothetical protein QM606_03290, partial [Leucobacter sp.]
MSNSIADPGSPTAIASSVPGRAAEACALIGIALVLAFGVYLRFADSGPLGIDEWWHGVVSAARGSAAYAVAVFMAE